VKNHATTVMKKKLVTEQQLFEDDLFDITLMKKDLA
jgi:hypothetical protein